MKSIVEYFSDQSGYECGYCHGSNSSLSHGMWAHTMTVQDYQDLIDQGWRRSGKYCYKPTMNKTCCPQYPIRCHVKDFTLNKSHKKVIKRVNRYLNTGVKVTGDEKVTEVQCPFEVCDVPVDGVPCEIDLSVQNGPARKPTADDQTSRSETLSSRNNTPSSVKKTKTSCLQDKPSESSVKNKTGIGADPDKPACKKAKLLRLERWQAKHKDDPDALRKYQEKVKANQAKGLEQFLEEVVENPAHQLEIRLVRSSPRSKVFEETLAESFQVYKKYQMVVHNDPESKVDMKQYTRFLVDSPLEEEYREGGSPDGFGSFHQHYVLDGKIVAVGVMDILPHCVSSVYLYYDPEYFFLTPGTYSALREIQFTQHMHTLEPSIKYYYLGFYIHSCPKMKYKGQYCPSDLVCPETYKWVDIRHCEKLLDKTKYARFAPPGEGGEQGNPALERVLVLHSRQAMPYAMYHMMNPEADDAEEVTQYAKLVGQTCSQRMLLYRS